MSLTFVTYEKRSFLFNFYLLAHQCHRVATSGKTNEAVSISEKNTFKGKVLAPDVLTHLQLDQEAYLSLRVDL